MEVFIVGGPINDEFIEQNPVISRTIEIRGDQTLEDLHHEIFDAFNREEEHMYEFQIGGRGPNDPKAKRYGLSNIDDGLMDDSKQKGNVSEITIHSLKLKADDIFGYWFDFGDDWWHQINVISVKENVPSGNYPRVIKRVGDSPP
jgi:hypothetical protein